MRLRIVTAALAVMSLSAGIANATPTHLWTHRYAVTDDQWIDEMVVDPFGNIVVVGSFYTALDLGEPYVGLGYQDAFVAKFDAAGNFLWSHQLADVRGDRAWDLATDLVGNVVCVGHLSSSSTDSDGFVVKYGPDGTQRWLKRFGVGDNQAQTIMGVSTNLSKEIIIAGEFDGSIDLGGGPLLATGGRTLFMAKLDQLGNQIWSKRFQTTTPNAYNIEALKTSADGKSVMIGAINGSVDFGSGLMTTTGAADMFIARFDAGGNVVWAHQHGGAGNQWPRALALNESGQIAIIGSIDGAVNLGGGVLTPVDPFDPIIAVFTPGGSHVWSKIFPATNYQFGFGVTWASNQDVLATIRGTGTLNLGGGALTVPGPDYGLWVARFFGANGNHRWSTMMTASMEGLIEEDDGRIILGGSVAGTMNLGGGETTGEADFLDIYLAKFGDALTGVSTPLISARLEQNVPNPFNPRTTIRYTLDAPARVQIGIYDASGARVTILDDGPQASGLHDVTWDGRDRAGKPVASGVYLYRFEGQAGAGRKMVLLK